VEWGTLWPTSLSLKESSRPISAYFKAGSFVVAAAVALFAAAGAVGIPSFWPYLAILAVVMIVSFATLDPDPSGGTYAAGRQEAAARAYSFCSFNGSLPDWTGAVSIGATTCLAGCKVYAYGRGRVRPGTVGDAREPVFLLRHSHPGRSRPARRQRSPRSSCARIWANLLARVSGCFAVWSR
jgi:hypothetical protein